ncbi:hypothetical protein [Glycomyces sp. YM15]|uniref:hypothetical protein n=1 Tax=Glycomyces sp. YM15 TaxID=2800446 RepID=UPI001964294F|nr:hypothetical protein [Glycomyces sp. YM15]
MSANSNPVSVAIKIGRGEVDSDSVERHSDRWGAINLTGEEGMARRAERGHIDVSDRIEFTDLPIGTVGDLVAIVIDDRNKPRPNKHPWGPAVWKPREWKAKDGEEVILGSGALFVEAPFDGAPFTEIGVQPLDGRTDHWMSLSAVDGSLVDLEFRPY